MIKFKKTTIDQLTKNEQYRVRSNLEFADSYSEDIHVSELIENPDPFKRDEKHIRASYVKDGIKRTTSFIMRVWNE